MPPPDPQPSDIATELRSFLHTGLPVPSTLTAPALLALSGVALRATDPRSTASRARALDGVLRWQLAQLKHDLADAARILFGASPGTAGASLTDRRAAAAQAAGYEVHHFRKRVEPRLCRLLADMLAADSEEVTAVHVAPPMLTAASRGPLHLPADVFAWEAVEHERMLSTLWAAIYALRAELLDLARLISMDAPASDRRRAAETTMWRYAQVLAAADDYRTAYGDALLHAETTLTPRGMARLAGWIPPLPDDVIDHLSAAAHLAATREDFLARVDAADRDVWHTAISTTSTTERTAS
ncbi:hypothetical protein FHS43_004284 [Streptosporangium becharense]|uniref:Uncharacterized protein n=1 Tax=Streptosporangium becharense TaxID=1816182 RepID=A0A7W9MF62_9ACTN|nr:hypothetical protein [Streptosporangium becharense]MBB2912989.1 hypothetical protein [Streptosporangium becharense]MBB5818186.1 hypothetical protein [Streptosporangium becharense]